MGKLLLSVLASALLFSGPLRAETFSPQPMTIRGATPEFGGRLWLPCSLGECVIDTAGGGHMMAVTPETLQYPKSGETEISTARGPSTCDIIDSIPFQIAGSDVGPLSFVRCPTLPANMSPMVGITAFEKKSFGFYFKSNQFRWLSQANLPLSLNRPRGKWLGFPVQMGNLSIAAVLDTGAPMTLVDHEFATAHPELFSPAIQTPTGYWIANALVPIQLGGISIPAGSVMIMDLKKNFGAGSPDLFLGMKEISRFNWEFDLSANKFSVF